MEENRNINGSLEESLRGQLAFVLERTDFDFLGTKYEGKVRDTYKRDDLLYLVTTDRLSCFDVVITTIPFKGQVLNQLAHYWFERTSDVVANHLISVPDPNVMLVKSCQVLPVEVVVRDYLAGSAGRDYLAGREISGIKLPAGLRPSQKLPNRIVTPATKEEKGKHDLPISEQEIVKRGLVSAKLWAEVREVALELFDLGSKEVAKRGLILVDTKYEFGLLDGKLILVDEIHTLDSSRFWRASSYQDRFEAGESPEMLDKETVRQWLISQGYMGEGEIPKISDEYRLEIAGHYIESFETISGQKFCAENGDVRSRIMANLKT